jgi:murein L,D-transpeptidase YcbB/YkuD
MRPALTLRVLLAFLALAGGCGPAMAETALEGRLRNRIEAGVLTDSLEVMDERIHARATMRELYPERGYQPIWVDEDGLLPRGAAFEAWLARVPIRHGLRPQDYHLSVIDELDESDRIAAMVDLELATTDAFLMVGSHFLAGRLNPETLDSEWVANRRHRPLAPLLDRASQSEDPGAVLEELLPTDSAYQALVQRLADLRQQRDAGRWAVVEPGSTLREGDDGDRVRQLIQRLAATQDLEDVVSHATFDADVARAVRNFQTRHGLAADGVVGQATLGALNVPVQARIDQIIVNLERWRWLPEDLGDFYVLVNIAGFRLDVIENDRSVLDMRVVVGQPYRRTPVFSGRIAYLVLNPYWEVPPSIAERDKLPLIKANPGYLTGQGYDLLQGWGEQERSVDPATVDWAAVSARNFPYRLRQRPGMYNALGRVKFMFPNKFSVYLHDTPSRELFGRDARAFSSGCIRLAAPLDLAELLLSDQPSWPRSAIDAAVASGIEQTVRLGRQVPVHLLYWTAWIDRDDGQLHFRDDVYGRDDPVLRELREVPPA